MSAVNVDEKLAVDKFFVDEGNAHIIVKKFLLFNSLPCLSALVRRVCTSGMKRATSNLTARAVWNAAHAGLLRAMPFWRNGNILRAPWALNTAWGNRACMRKSCQIYSGSKPHCPAIL